jgi:hypothetical protein
MGCLLASPHSGAFLCRRSKTHGTVIPDNQAAAIAHRSLLLDDPRCHHQAGIAIQDKSRCPTGLSEDSIGEAAQHGVSSGVERHSEHHTASLNIVQDICEWFHDRGR